MPADAEAAKVLCDPLQFTDDLRSPKWHASWNPSATVSRVAENPYAPPVADGPPSVEQVEHPSSPYRIPSAAILLSRVNLGTVALALLVAGCAGVGMRELWDPAPTYRPEVYTAMLGAHGALMIFGVIVPVLFAGIGHVFVVEALRVRRLSSAWLGWLAWLAWVCGCAALLAGTGDDWTAYAPGGLSPLLVGGALAFAASLLLVGIHFVFVLVSGYGSAATSARLAALAFVLPLFVLALAVVLGSTLDAVMLHPVLGCTISASLALAYHLVVRRGEWRPAPLVVALALAAILVGTVVTSGLTSLGAMVGKLVAVSLCARAVLRGSARTSPPMLYLGLGVAPALLVEAFATVLLENLSVDVHLRDTYFVVGRAHLLGGIVLFTSLAAVHMWSDELFGRSYRPNVARIACVLVCSGTVGMAVLMLMLGQNGMPRRYLHYTEIFATEHRAATIAAFATATGLALVLVALFTRARRRPRDTAR